MKMNDLFNSPEIVQAVTAGITAIVSAITGLIVRKLEKAKLRREGKLND